MIFGWAETVWNPSQLINKVDKYFFLFKKGFYDVEGKGLYIPAS